MLVDEHASARVHTYTRTHTHTHTHTQRERERERESSSPKQTHAHLHRRRIRHKLSGRFLAAKAHTRIRQKVLAQFLVHITPTLDPSPTHTLLPHTILNLNV